MGETTSPPYSLMQSGHSQSHLDGSGRQEPNSAPRFSRLGYQESIEKARRAKAVNSISLHEEKRHRSRAEAARKASIRKQQLEDQRAREEEATWTGREYGAKLLESLEVQTKARLEAGFREEIRARVYGDEKLFSSYQEVRKEEITLQLEEELEPIIKSKLELAKMKEVLDLLREELRPGVMQSLREELEDTTREEVRAELGLQLKEDVVHQLRLENVVKVKADLRRELREEALQEQERELMQKTTTCDEIFDVNLPASLTEAAGSSLRDTGNDDKLDNNMLPEHIARSRDQSIDSAWEAAALPESEHGTDRDHCLATGPLSAKHGVEEGVDTSRQLSEPELPPEGLPSTGHPVEQSASKDFTFDPSIHDIRFSDPVDSPVSTRKRSSSASELSNAEAEHAAKRVRRQSIVSDNISTFNNALFENHALDFTVRQALNVSEMGPAADTKMKEVEEESREESVDNDEEEAEEEGGDEEEDEEEKEEEEEEDEAEDEDAEEREVDHTEDEENERTRQSYSKRPRGGAWMDGSDVQSESDEDEETFATSGGFANAGLNDESLDYTPTSSQQGLDYNTDTQTDDFESSSEAYDEYDERQHGPPKLGFVNSLIKQGNTQETAIDLGDSDDGGDDEGENEETLVEGLRSRSSMRADKIS